ncbi:MAG TPA: hypothetical protein VKA84_15650 [Gemmatimonadaceae bacterium]|nr:hypothetical protein [Gemmatimonadaceae bacterium]
MTTPTYAASPPHARPLAELAEAAEVEEEGRALLQPRQHPLEFVRALTGAGRHADAIRFLAHAIPKREAVWWAWMAARRALPPGDPPPKLRGALDATERWLTQPSEEHRRAAMAAAEVAGLGTAAGCAALAAFLSGGSIAPPDAPAVPPGEFLTAKAVTGAVLSAAAAGDPEKLPETLRASAEQGVELAQRIQLWPPPATAPAAPAAAAGR